MNTLTASHKHTGFGTGQHKSSRAYTWIAHTLALLGALWLSLPAFADTGGPTLNGITYNALPGDKVEVRLKLSAPPAAEPRSFTIDNPARIALDLPNTQLNLAKKTENINSGAANSVTAVEASGRTRVVFNLVKLVPYKVKVEGDSVVVTLDSPGATTASAAATGKAAGPAMASIESIDFRRGSKGQGNVVVKLSNPSVAIDMREEGRKIVVDYIGTKLPDKLNRKLDVTDFATPVQTIDTFPHGNGTRMVITPTGNYEDLAYQADDTYTVEVKPLTPAQQEARKKKEFTGQRLSLNFQNIQVRAVLQLLADFTGLNIVASDTVTGSVTLRLKNVPWDQALDIILKSKGLGMRRYGNVIMVAPEQELAAREKLELEAKKQISELAPLKTQFIQINYAKAKDIAKLLKSKQTNLLSKRGNITVDDRTNTLLVQDTADRLEEIRKLVAKLDIPVRQVLIESRVVVANQDFTKDLGVRFGYSQFSSQNTAANGGLFESIGGKVPGDTNYGGNTSFHTGNLENYIVSLPVTNPAGALGLAVGKIGNYLLQLELSALQLENRGEVISNPRVITANQKEATIESGTEIPYQEATSSGATSVSFKKAELSLKVTPQITPDDRIIMDLTVNNDSVGQIYNGVPSIDTQALSTQVLVNNGETVVLGGVYKQTKNHNIERVPFFGDLPYLGVLFRNKHLENNKTELLIFITPKILKQSLTEH